MIRARKRCFSFRWFIFYAKKNKNFVLEPFVFGEGKQQQQMQAKKNSFPSLDPRLPQYRFNKWMETKLLSRTIEFSFITLAGARCDYTTPTMMRLDGDFSEPPLFGKRVCAREFCYCPRFWTRNVRPSTGFVFFGKIYEMQCLKHYPLLIVANYNDLSCKLLYVRICASIRPSSNGSNGFALPICFSRSDKLLKI